MEDINLYISEISKYPLLTPEEEKELGEKVAKTKDKGAMDKLVLSNLRLVIAIAKKYYTNTSLSLMDLIQEGNIGLIKASRKYDYTKGTRFSTYATYWIRQSISQAITNNSRTIRMPLHAVLELNRVNSAKSELEKQGIDPTIELIADLAKLAPDRVKLLLEVDSKMLSLDYDYDTEDDNCNLGRIITDKSLTPEEKCLQEINKTELHNIIDSLGETEAQIIKLRYGLIDGEAKTFEEIGKVMHMTREKVRQKSIMAMNILQQPQYIKQLREIEF